MQQKTIGIIEPAKRKKWALMPILDFYILREFLIPLTALITGFIILFLMGNIFEDLKELLDNKASINVIIQFFLLKLPGNIRFILPISVMLACMYTMANFGKNMEMTAMRASGIPMQRACMSIYLVAIIITGINFWFNEAIVPTSEKKAEVLRKSLGNEKYKYDVFNMLTYRSPDKLSTWFFRYFDAEGVQKDVIIKKYDSQMKLLWTVEAKSAQFFPEKGWKLANGNIVNYQEDGFLPGPPIEFEEKWLDIREFSETPRDIANNVKPPSEISSVVILEILHKTKNMAASSENIYKTTLYSRLAFPWTCLIAVFLGVPLAVKNERSGIFMSVVIAVAIMVVYQLVSNFLCILGSRGYLPPLIAGFGPTAAFVIYGWLNVKKHN